MGMIPPSKSVIEMKLEGPLADLGNLGVIDLDFVGHGMSGLGDVAIVTAGKRK